MCAVGVLSALPLLPCSHPLRAARGEARAAMLTEKKGDFSLQMHLCALKVRRGFELEGLNQGRSAASGRGAPVSGQHLHHCHLPRDVGALRPHHDLCRLIHLGENFPSRFPNFSEGETLQAAVQRSSTPHTCQSSLSNF